MTDLYRLAIRKDQAAADALDELRILRYRHTYRPLVFGRSRPDPEFSDYYASAEAYRVAYDAYRAALEL